MDTCGKEVPFCCQCDSDHAKNHGDVHEEARRSYVPNRYTSVPRPRGARRRRRSAMELATSTGHARARFHVLRELKHKGYRRPSCREVFVFGLKPLLPPHRRSLLHPSAGTSRRGCADTAAHVRVGIARSHISSCLPSFGVEKTE